MSEFYKKLNIPLNPFRRDFDYTMLPVNKPGAGQLQPTADIGLLNQATLDAFNSVGLEHERIFVLGNKPFLDPDPLFDVCCGAHKDVHWIHDRWQYQLFAINYELTRSLHTVAWKFWEITAQEIFPNAPKSEEEGWFRGQHYHTHQTGTVPNYGDPDDYQVIDQFILDRPTLCRVDVAHSVHHTNVQDQRYGLTIRFKHSFKTWEQVLQKLSPLFL